AWELSPESAGPSLLESKPVDGDEGDGGVAGAEVVGAVTDGGAGGVVGVLGLVTGGVAGARVLGSAVVASVSPGLVLVPLVIGSGDGEELSPHPTEANPTMSNTATRGSRPIAGSKRW